ncbi:MAG: hypothetical protein V7731_15535 [Amphritea sp.]
MGRFSGGGARHFSDSIVVCATAWQHAERIDAMPIGNDTGAASGDTLAGTGVILFKALLLQ